MLAPGAAGAARHDALVPAGLVNAAKADPGRTFRVIVQGDRVSTPSVATAVEAEISANPGNAKGLRRRFAVISGVAADLTGRQILALAHRPSILAITPDTQLRGSLAGPALVAAPTIGGTAVEGGTLTASAGVWTGTEPLTYAYQWQFCDLAMTCTNIANQVAATLVVPAGAIGSLVRVVVTATDAVGASASAPSDTLTVAAPPPPPPPTPVPPTASTPPVITGNPWEGAVLTATAGVWTGTEPLTYAYQWQFCDLALICTDIGNQVAATFVVPPGAVGSLVRVVVTATDPAGGAAAPSGTLTIAAPPPPPPPPTLPPPPQTASAPPVITGDAREGAVLTASAGVWSGTGPLTYAYQWQVCDAAMTCTNIANQTAATFAVPAGSAGTLVRVVVTAADTAGASASAASNTLTIAAPPPPPVPPTVSAPPVITGDAREGAVLTASDGVWTASSPVSISYQWQRCGTSSNCSDLAGAKAAAYTVTLGDVGATLRAVVTATSVDGAASAVSTETAPILPLLHGGVWSSQIWPAAAGLPGLWDAVAQSPAPTIAVVDSGIDPNTPDVAGRITDQATITQSANNSPGDGYGHGTLVASLAAGNAAGRAGAAPSARLVSLDVLDDQGMALTSDVVAAADWIYQHKDADAIRVANFSLTGSAGASFQYDPLDHALERLWLSGVVVVASAGNYAVNGQPSGVPFAPGNDPLVITVGADDTVGTASPGDDVTAPWSAFGSTIDGFGKPDLGAPGRMLIAAVPTTATLTREHPDRVVGPGLMQLSGTSLAAPIVAGTAADILALHPTWTPDQVKGALMVTATALPNAVSTSSGIGEIEAAAAASVNNPPNPNAALEQFLVPGAVGSPPSIDTSAWSAAAAADPGWASAYWGSAYWGSAYWGSAYWGSAYWGSTASGAAYWGSAYLAAAYWGSSYWGSTIDAPSAVNPPAPNAYWGSLTSDVLR